MEISGVVGSAAKQPEKDGSDLIRRHGKTGEGCGANAHQEHYEAVSRGRVFSACSAAAGVAPGTSLGTTGAFTLHNPLNSGFNLVILTASCVLPYKATQVTLGAGTIFWTTHAGVAVVNPTGTAIIVRPNLLGNSAQGVALAFENSTVATQIPLRPFAHFGAIVSDTTATDPFMMIDHVNGEFIVGPGFSIGLNGITAAGASPILQFGMSWEEVPIS